MRETVAAEIALLLLLVLVVVVVVDGNCEVQEALRLSQSFVVVCFVIDRLQIEMMLDDIMLLNVGCWGA